MIPAELRRDLGLSPGASVLISETDDGDMLVSTPVGGLRRAQELVRRYVQPDVSLADELLAERRAEAARE